MILKKTITVIFIALVAGMMAMMPVSAKETHFVKMSMQTASTAVGKSDIDERSADGMMSQKEKEEVNKILWLLIRLDGIIFSLVTLWCALQCLTSARTIDDFFPMLVYQLRMPFALGMVIVIFRLLVNVL